MLEVQQPEKLRRASLISEIYSETHFPPSSSKGRDKKRFSAISGTSVDGKDFASVPRFTPTSPSPSSSSSSTVTSKRWWRRWNFVFSTGLPSAVGWGWWWGRVHSVLLAHPHSAAWDGIYHDRCRSSKLTHNLCARVRLPWLLRSLQASTDRGESHPCFNNEMRRRRLSIFN